MKIKIKYLTYINRFQYDGNSIQRGMDVWEMVDHCAAEQKSQNMFRHNIGKT